MFVKLRHINGENLIELEKRLEDLSKSVSISHVHVTKGGSQWYIHFLVEGAESPKAKNKIKGDK